MKWRGIAILISLFTSGGAFSTASWARESIQVSVSIPPQKYFVERVAGDLAKVSVMVPPGANPAIYEPRPVQMKAIAHSKLYFAIGVPFERMWLDKIIAVNPQMQVVHTDMAVKKRELVSGHRHGEKNSFKKRKTGRTGGDKEVAMDPHIWLSPPLVRIQAGIIADALIKIDPGHKGTYQENLKAFEVDLDKLDADLRRIFEGRGEAAHFLVFHPSWGYFADTYGLRQVPVEVEGKEPSASEIARLIRYCRDKGIRVVFAQPQFSAKSAQTIAREIGGEVVFADPLHEDWMKNLRSVAAKVRAALR